MSASVSSFSKNGIRRIDRVRGVAKILGFRAPRQGRDNSRRAGEENCKFGQGQTPAGIVNITPHRHALHGRCWRRQPESDEDQYVIISDAACDLLFNAAGATENIEVLLWR